MTAILVDDEKHCRDVLAFLLAKYCPQITLLAACTDGPTGLEALEKYQPDLLFLDIEMPGMSGFDLLSKCRNPSFRVVFTTAYNEYAIQAIRHNALDYILKPVDKDELLQAVSKASEMLSARSGTSINALVAYLNHQKTGDRIALPTMEGLQILTSEEIYYCESDGGYTHFFLTNGKVILISKTLKEVEEVLESKGFCRIHHGFLINVRYVIKYLRGDGGEVIMANNKNIPVSRNKKQEFLNLLERI